MSEGFQSYDYAGSWDPTAGHQANLYPSSTNPGGTPFNGDAAVEYYINVGRIAPSKIVLGMPLYGRAFVDTDGPGRPYTGGVGPGSWENGIWDYKALPTVGSRIVVDDEVVASYSYDPATRTMISFDSPDQAKRKAEYIRQRGLAGAMWWESSGDVCSSDDNDHHHRSLISTVSTVVQPSNLTHLSPFFFLFLLLPLLFKGFLDLLCCSTLLGSLNADI